MAIIYIINFSDKEKKVFFQDDSTKVLRELEKECLQFLFGQAASHAATKKEWYRLNDMLEQLDDKTLLDRGWIEVSDEDIKSLDTAIDLTGKVPPTGMNIFGGRPLALNKCNALLKQINDPKTKEELEKAKKQE
jgi:hypothetical protein